MYIVAMSVEIMEGIFFYFWLLYRCIVVLLCMGYWLGVVGYGELGGLWCFVFIVLGFMGVCA